MDETVFVSLSQWVRWTKKLGIENTILIGARDGCAKSENESESYQFHKKEKGCYISFAAGISAAVELMLPASGFGHSGHSA